MVVLTSKYRERGNTFGPLMDAVMACSFGGEMLSPVEYEKRFTERLLSILDIGSDSLLSFYSVPLL